MSATPLYIKGGHTNMAVSFNYAYQMRYPVNYSFQISGENPRNWSAGGPNSGGGGGRKQPEASSLCENKKSVPEWPNPPPQKFFKCAPL